MTTLSSASPLPQRDALIQPLAPNVLHRWPYPGLDPNDRPQNVVLWDVREGSELVNRSGWPLYDRMGGIQGWAQLGFPVEEVRPCA